MERIYVRGPQFGQTQPTPGRIGSAVHCRSHGGGNNVPVCQCSSNQGRQQRPSNLSTICTEQQANHLLPRFWTSSTLQAIECKRGKAREGRRRCRRSTRSFGVSSRPGISKSGSRLVKHHLHRRLFRQWTYMRACFSTTNVTRGTKSASGTLDKKGCNITSNKDLCDFGGWDEKIMCCIVVPG